MQFHSIFLVAELLLHVCISLALYMLVVAPYILCICFFD